MSSILLYQTDQGKVHVEVRFKDETFWLTRKMMAELFQCSTDNISLHLKNIFSTKELAQDSVTEESSATANDGKSYRTKFYNLDAVIAVGYRVNSLRATQFRIWATGTLKEFIIKGFVLDDERLKQGNRFGQDHFDELLARIRDIRASEKRFYQKVRDLFMLSDDYDKTDKKTEHFFAEVQNKLLFAVTKRTAAEVINDRASAELPNMGLTTWRGERVRKEDIFIAENYLTEEEVDTLNRVVTLFLDTAELRVKERIPLSLAFWRAEADHVIQFSRKPLLDHAGTVSHEQMKAIATRQYELFDDNRRKIEAADADNLEQKAIEDLIKKAKGADEKG